MNVYQNNCGDNGITGLIIVAAHNKEEAHETLLKDKNRISLIKDFVSEGIIKKDNWFLIPFLTADYLKPKVIVGNVADYRILLKR